jgi:hypothetical protein
LPEATCVTISVNTGPSGENYSPALCGGSTGPEAVFRYVAPQSGTLFVNTTSGGFEKVLYYSDGVCGMPVACDRSAGYGAANLSINTVSGETYWIVIDGSDQEEWGSTTLSLGY